MYLLVRTSHQYSYPVYLMNPFFSELLKELNASVAVLLVLLVVVIWLVWKLSAAIAIWQYKHGEHDKKLQKAGETNDKVIAMEANIGKAVEFGERIIRMETKLDLVFQKLSPNPFAQSQSPIALTPQGIEIAVKVDADATIDRLYPVLRALVERKLPKTAYDIQEGAFAVVRDNIQQLMSEAELNNLKNEAFNKGMLLDSFLIIYAIKLRDRMLVEKNIAIGDIDKHSADTVL